MSIAIVDARGWQNTLDFKTGEKVESQKPVVEMVRDVLRKHPFPGDLDHRGNRWVSDTAIDLINGYRPSFIFLTYAMQYFSGRYKLMTKEMRARMISAAFLEAERFIKVSGFSAIMVGTGDMTPLLGYIDATRLDGFAVCGVSSSRYARLHKPSTNDLKILREHPHIEKIVSREEVLSLFKGTPEQTLMLPEYLMLAREGYTFKTLSGITKTSVMIPSFNFNVPVYAPGHVVTDITDVRKAVEKDLSEKNVALIVMEGVGLNEFLWPHMSCRNGIEWYYYETGKAQYLTISSGEHRFLDNSAGFKYFDKAEITKDYPFSGSFKSMPEGTFASTFQGRSIAVGNRSMFIHTLTGADIAVECFARDLYNQGTMAVIHREDKLL